MFSGTWYADDYNLIISVNLYDLIISVSLLYIMNLKNIWIRFRIIFKIGSKFKFYLKCQKD